MSAALLALSLSLFAQDDLEPLPEGPPPPEVYSFSHQNGRLAAMVFESAETENSGRSHHHVVVAGAWSGRLLWADGPDCAGEFQVAVGGLVADDPEERKAAQVGPRLTDQDQAKVNEHLRSRDQLFIERFPTIKYDVKSCTPEADGRYKIVGDFTLRGVTSPVAFRVSAEEKGGTLSLSGEGSITHTAFGFEPYYALFGQRQNQDRMLLTIQVKGDAVGPNASLNAPIIEAAP
jgi:polyisoprenoid-binding protein YceI